MPDDGAKGARLEVAAMIGSGYFARRIGVVNKPAMAARRARDSEARALERADDLSRSE